jgi:RimJ/RimL family protein N-acetyltransferase
MSGDQRAIMAIIASKELARIVGPNLVLRLITSDDAEYVHSLRTDARYNLYLSDVDGGVDDQRRWIESYKAREHDLKELYYVIELRDGIRCGLVRLYNIKEGSFTWGSWILDHNKPIKAALESAVLIYMIGFEKLGIPKAVFDVRRANHHTISFHQRFNAIQTNENELDVFFEYSASQFAADKPQHIAILEGEKGQ